MSIPFISFIQSAGDSSMSSGSLGDRRSDSPDLRSLSPGGNYKTILWLDNSIVKIIIHQISERIFSIYLHFYES